MRIAPRVLLALAFPIVALAGLAGVKQARLSLGARYVLPIQGYDPRDLLSGHYLTFRVDYGIQGLCQQRETAENWVCLEPRRDLGSDPSGEACEARIRGRCQGWRFEAGIERFYVPESEARRLESLIRDRRASIEVRVARDGRAVIQDLLIDGRSWKSR